MLPELSRRTGRILSLSKPAATIEQRNEILRAASKVDTWEDLPQSIVDLLEKLKAGKNQSESRAARQSTVNRQIIKRPNICQQCRMNNDPNNVPVHPNCDCDVITDSIETGVADPESRFLSKLSRDTLEIIGDLEAASIQLDPGSIAILDGDTARFADFARWLETVQPYLDAGGQYVSIVVDDDSDEAVQNIQETVEAVTEDSEDLVEALKNRKLWFSIAKAVVL